MIFSKEAQNRKMAKKRWFWAIFGHFASTLNAYISASFAFYELKFSGKTLKEVS